MEAETINQQDKDEWREFVLREIVNFVGARKDEIYENYHRQGQGKLSQEAIKEAGLMDFEIAITFLQDKKQNFGLGFGFFKANVIR